MRFLDRPTVYVVALPLGNLEDITLRARRILQEVEVIAAEDTRVTRKLLALLEITPKQLVSYHDIGEEKTARRLVARLLEEHLTLALVSDAGTPCIADPGYRLVAQAKAAGIAVVPIPGPSSVVALASVAGLPTDRLMFIGFLPNREGQLRRECRSWRMFSGSIIAFESARRLEKSLGIIAELYPQARVAIGRELTKVFEEIHTMGAVEALRWWQAHAYRKGEVSLMISLGDEERPQEQIEEQVKARALEMIQQGATHKDVLRQVKHFGLSKKELYSLLLPLFKA